MKINNTQFITLPTQVLFDSHRVKWVKFDLLHINKGWNKELSDYNEGYRSHYTASDVVDIFEQFDYYQIEWEEDRNKFRVDIRGEKYFRYIALVSDYESLDELKIVVDVPILFLGGVVIVTIY